MTIKMNLKMKDIARSIRKKIRYLHRHYKIKYFSFNRKTYKVILGAAEINQSGWLSTNEQWLDITKRKDWIDIFRKRKKIVATVSERFCQHLTYREMCLVLDNINEFSNANVHIRVAVPDGCNPNHEYIGKVTICGTGDYATDHKQLLDVNIFFCALESKGFKPALVEGYSEDCTLIQSSWTSKFGFILRSRQNKGISNWDFIDADTSPIVDAIKV